MRFAAAALCLCFAGLSSCGDSAPPPAAGSAAQHPPVIVIGVDGAEWKVIRKLWQEGELPHLRALADRGVSSVLKSAYASSPVIWTTIATGHVPAIHGITGFVVPGPKGDVPVSSALRRVPAIWNLLTLVGLKVAVLGWYVTWPAEEVNGLMVTDRVARPTLQDRVYPGRSAPRSRPDSRGPPRAADRGELSPRDR